MRQSQDSCSCPTSKSILSFLTTTRLHLSSHWNSVVSFCFLEKWRGWTKWPLGFSLALPCYESFDSLLWDDEIRALYFPRPHLASVLSCSIPWRNWGSRSVPLRSWPLCWCYGPTEEQKRDLAVAGILQSHWFVLLHKLTQEVSRSREERRPSGVIPQLHSLPGYEGSSSFH